MGNSCPVKPLTAKEMKLAILVDVIARLPYLSVKSSNGYIANISSLDLNEWEQAQNHLNKIEEHCKVCALGSLLLSHIRFNNNFSIEQLICVGTFGRGITVNSLEVWFTRRELDMIECSFERGISRFSLSDEDAKRAVDFGCRFNGDKERLGQIVLNAILHDGVFTP